VGDGGNGLASDKGGVPALHSATRTSSGSLRRGFYRAMMTEFPRATRRLPFSGLRDDREAEEIKGLSGASAVAGREPAQNSNTPEPIASSTAFILWPFRSGNNNHSAFESWCSM
jgi:hypothetical protein